MINFGNLRNKSRCSEESLPVTSRLWPSEVGSLSGHRADGSRGSWRGKRCQAAPGCCHLPAAVCTGPASFELHQRSSGSTAETKKHWSSRCFRPTCWLGELPFTCPHALVSHIGGQSKRLQAWTGLGLGFWQSSSLRTLVLLLSREGRWVQATVRVMRPTPQVAEHELHSPVSHLSIQHLLLNNIQVKVRLHWTWPAFAC